MGEDLPSINSRDEESLHDTHEVGPTPLARIQQGMLNLTQIAARESIKPEQDARLRPSVNVPGQGVLSWNRYQDGVTGAEGLHVRMTRRTLNPSTGLVQFGSEIDAHMIQVDGVWQPDPVEERALSISDPPTSTDHFIYYLHTAAEGTSFKTRGLTVDMMLEEDDVDFQADRVDEFVRVALETPVLTSTRGEEDSTGILTEEERGQSGTL